MEVVKNYEKLLRNKFPQSLISRLRILVMLSRSRVSVMFLLANSGRAGRKNIWLEVMSHGPNAATSVLHDQESCRLLSIS